MKYRILADGKDYIIQTNCLYFFWETVKYCSDIISHMPTFFPIRFKTEKRAENYAKVRWGSSRERVRKYQIV